MSEINNSYKVVSVNDVLEMFGDYLTPEQAKEVEMLVLKAKRDNNNGNIILLQNESGVRLYIESGKQT